MQGGAGHPSKRNLPRAYFDLQLRFAESIAIADGVPLGDSVARNTDFHRRFGLGRLRDGTASPGWMPYLGQLLGLETHEERVTWTWAFFQGSPAEAPPAYQHLLGCFGYDAPDVHGVVRIHFADNDRRDGTGPLARAKIPDRKRELGELFAQVGAHFPQARSVRGGSWLYNLEAYRRLFPPAYVASCERLDRLPRYDGLSTWGQFLDHRGSMKTALRERFLGNLADLGPRCPSRAFPLPLLVASAPIERFFEFYAV